MKEGGTTNPAFFFTHTKEGGDMMRPNKRECVYHAIDTEREYQNALPISRTDGGDHTVGDYVTMLGHYHTKLVAAWTDHPGNDAALEVMRKCGGIAVRCMEEHGAPVRTVPVHKPQDPVFFKPSGTWWHSDETWSDEYGPFDTEDEARMALDAYCLALNGREKAEAKDLSGDGMSEVAGPAGDPVGVASHAWPKLDVIHSNEDGFWHTGGREWHGPFKTEEKARAHLQKYTVTVNVQAKDAAGFKEADKLEWLDVSDEQWREYIYPDGTRYRVDFPLKLNVTKKPGGDSHRVVTENRSVYVAAGWRAIEWQVKPGKEPFTF